MAKVKEQPHPIDNWYSEDLRWKTIAEGTWKDIRPLLIGLHNERSERPDRAAALDLAETVLAEVARAAKSPNGINGHSDVKDYQRLVEGLSTPQATLRVATIMCPDWGWHEEPGPDEKPVVVYEMNKLNDGFPKTGETIEAYLKILGEQARRSERAVEFSAHVPAWEVTRAPILDGINGNISRETALELLGRSAGVSAARLALLDNEYLTTGVKLADPEGFHEQAQTLAEQMLLNQRGKINTTLRARAEFYNGLTSAKSPDEMVARDLAEATLGFRHIASQADVIVVPTSPSIARACLSGGDIPWIQLTTGYKG